MGDVPLISALIPVYNGRKYLADAIDSVLTQTCRDFELIVIDDGSTDGTDTILEQYARNDSRVRLTFQPNVGVSAALNHGLTLARGSLIARMDADDICLPERFAKQSRFLQEHPDHVLVGSRCLLIDPAGYPICEKHDIMLSHNEIDAALLAMSWPLVHPAVMMRTEALKQIGGYDTTYRTNQDHDLFLRLAEVGKLANLDEVLLKYRQHFGSIGFKKVAAESGTVVDIVRAAHLRRGIPFTEPRPVKPRVLLPREHRSNWWWWSLQAGNLATARRHALAMIREAPLSGASWRAMYCALRGH